jgi:pimeloyl-ACP methyl ester carboxylesterase
VTSRSDVIPEPSGIQFLAIGANRLEVQDIPASRPGAPDLLLLHEGLGSISLWRDFPAQLALATGSRVVTYSRAGFGRSSPRMKPYTPRFMHEEAFETIPALREQLRIERPLLVGHSTGASMALVHAGAAEVAGVVAMAPIITVEGSNLESIRAARHAYATTDWRAKLARHHDDVDAVFRGWNDTWLDPAFHSWDILADVAKVRAPILAHPSRPW